MEKLLTLYKIFTGIPQDNKGLRFQTALRNPITSTCVISWKMDMVVFKLGLKGRVASVDPCHCRERAEMMQGVLERVTDSEDGLGWGPKRLTSWTMSYVIGSKLQRCLKGVCSTPEEGRGRIKRSHQRTSYKQTPGLQVMLSWQRKQQEIIERRG